jgi:histidine ammonia-lyase
VDSLPTSANQEDHVSMATFAARRLQSMLRNTEYIVAIELLAAAQGIEFLRPLKSSAVLEGILTLVRSASPAMMVDRSLAPDMELVRSQITQGKIGLAGEAQISELSAFRLG